MFDTTPDNTQLSDETTTAALESQVAEALEEKVVNAEATPAEEAPVEDTTPKDSIGLANLRSHAESLEADINNIYKPVLGTVEKFGGIDAVEDGMALYSSLQEYEADKAAASFLDKVYELSPERYNAVVANIFETHGDAFLKYKGVGETSEEGEKGKFDWKDLDEQDPVRELIENLQQQVEGLRNELDRNNGQKQQDTVEAEKESRLQEFFKNRYDPLEKSLSSLNFGDDTKVYRDDIRRSVEGAIEEDPHLMKIFNEAAVMVRDGNGKLAASRITEFDRKASEIISQVIQRHTSRYATETAAIKNKIENNNLPKATEAAPAAPVRAVPVMEQGAKAFDDNTLMARLRALEASGRLPAR